jgi:hypothetical protein
VGSFDFVVAGSLLVHLRDPIGALEAIRGVCRGQFLSAAPVTLALSLLLRRRPLAQLNGSGDRIQWWMVNAAGHRQELFSAGFHVERESRLYSVPFGVSHPGSRTVAPEGGVRGLAVAAMQRLATRRVGVPHHAALCSPREGL